MIKITPILYNGQTGKPDVEENDMTVACKQAVQYIIGGLKSGKPTFKFFVITDLERNDSEPRQVLSDTN